MTSDEKKRVVLDFGDDLDKPPVPPVDTSAVKAATRAAGFRETPRPPETSTQTITTGTTRRARRKTGRTEQFATRLRADTLEAIYHYADRHEITLAETIERAMQSLVEGDAS